jgi:imidazolonepropionase-like amidohydrolase
MALAIPMTSLQARRSATVIQAGRSSSRIRQGPGATIQILIEGPCTAVGAAVAAPADARVLDLGAYTLLPGLIDAHTHMTTERPGKRALDHMTATGADYAFVGMANAGRMLRAGFTTVRDLGGFDFADLATKRAIDRGDIDGPRMQVALSIISITGGHGDPPTASARPSRSTASRRRRQPPSRCG